MSKEAIAALNQLASKLGTTAEHLWGVLVRQAYIDGWLQIFWSVFWLVVLGVPAIYFLRLFAVAYRKTRSESNPPEDFLAHLESEDLIGVFFVVCLFAAMAVVLSVAVATSAITSFSNPEYRALEYVLKIVNK